MVEDELVTEAGSNPQAGYENRATRELVELMNAGDATVSAAVGAASSPLAAAIDAVVERLRAGGRLVYVGAGTSGGIAALDAAECETTFSTPPGAVVALVAGSGASALTQAAAEDDRAAGAIDIAADRRTRRRRRGRDQRQRIDAVRARCDRGSGARGRADHRRRVGIGLGARGDSRSRGGGRRRSRVPRGLDAPQGGHRAEARPQHHLDDLDDPAREDLRKPHGRRRAREREAPRARATNRRGCDRRAGRRCRRRSCGRRRGYASRHRLAARRRGRRTKRAPSSRAPGGAFPAPWRTPRETRGRSSTRRRQPRPG